MTSELKKDEAIERMKKLRLHSNVIKEFQKEDKLNLSEAYGALFWLDDKQKERVAEFERKYNALVYHVIHGFATFGEYLAYLYISDEEDEWEYDREDIEQGIAFAFVDNLSDECCSEFGSIGIKPMFGGVIRTA